MKKDSKYAKKIKYGTMAAIITAFVVAIVIVVNIIIDNNELDLENQYYQ